MTEPGYPTSRHDYASDAEELKLLERSMDEGPKGAVAVSVIAVVLLLIGWLGMYFLVFLPRGTVG
jgi:Cytochrome c oxidase subunit IIa family